MLILLAGCLLIFLRLGILVPRGVVWGSWLSACVCVSVRVGGGLGVVALCLRVCVCACVCVCPRSVRVGLRGVSETIGIRQLESN